MRPIDYRVKGLESMLKEISRISEEIVENVVSLKATPDSIRKRINDVREMRLEIHRNIVEIMARYQPTASDLRGLIAALEISYGLYRFSRYALDISTVLDR
ncbi:MAG: PhoU domain-containing protein, partial [Sulfolobales archaeon]